MMTAINVLFLVAWLAGMLYFILWEAICPALGHEKEYEEACVSVVMLGFVGATTVGAFEHYWCSAALFLLTVFAGWMYGGASELNRVKTELANERAENLELRELAETVLNSRPLVSRGIYRKARKILIVNSEEVDDAT